MLNPIIGGIFGTQTKWDADGNMVTQDEFHLRLYRDLWESGAIKRLKGNMLHVYLTIALHLDNSGEGWPTQERISKMCGINRNTACTAIKKLVNEGFIEAEKVRTTGKFDNCIYKIKFSPKGEKQQYDNISTMPKKSSRKNHHGKLGTKKELGFKKDPFSKKDINKQQPKIEIDENRVVVVREVFESLFQKKLSKKHAVKLITLSAENNVDVIHKIQNTHAMHEVEPRDKIVGSIIYAIENGDWEISTPVKKKSKSLPKTVQEQINRNNGIQTNKVIRYTPEQIAQAKSEIERKIDLLYADEENSIHDAL